MRCREKRSVARNEPDSGNVSEPWPKRFLGEYSDKRVSDQDSRPNFRPIYQERPDSALYSGLSSFICDISYISLYSPSVPSNIEWT